MPPVTVLHASVGREAWLEQAKRQSPPRNDMRETDLVAIGTVYSEDLVTPRGKNLGRVELHKQRAVNVRAVIDCKRTSSFREIFVTLNLYAQHRSICQLSASS